MLFDKPVVPMGDLRQKLTAEQLAAFYGRCRAQGEGWWKTPEIIPDEHPVPIHLDELYEFAFKGDLISKIETALRRAAMSEHHSHCGLRKGKTLHCSCHVQPAREALDGLLKAQTAAMPDA